MRNATGTFKASRVKIGDKFIRAGVAWTVVNKRYYPPMYGIHSGEYEFCCHVAGGGRGVMVRYAKSDTLLIVD